MVYRRGVLDAIDSYENVRTCGKILEEKCLSFLVMRRWLGSSGSHAFSQFLYEGDGVCWSIEIEEEFAWQRKVFAVQHFRCRDFDVLFDGGPQAQKNDRK